MNKQWATKLCKVLEKSKEPLEKFWYYGKPFSKDQRIQRSSNENSSTQTNRKKEV